MLTLNMKVRLKYIKFWPLAVIAGLIFLFYRPFFTKGLRPIPADITPGMYYPWLDYKFPKFPNNIPVKNSLPSDVVSLTYPLRLLSVNLLKNHEWPLWNSLILCGTPLLANFQSAALYPLNFLYFLINNFSLAWSLQVIFQPILGLLFTYWFLRGYGLNKIACLFGATVWSFGSFFSIWGQYNTVIHAIVYLPLASLSLKKLETSIVWGLGLTMAIAFSIYAGNPPMTLIMLLTLGIYSLIRFKLNVKQYIWPIIFGILALGITAPLLIPGFINSGLSIRKSDTVAEDNNIKFLPIRQLITLVSPDFFGNPTTLNHWAPGLYDNLTIFVGVIPLLLFFISLFQPIEKNRDLNKFYKIIFLGSWILMIKNPVSVVVGNLPILGFNSMVMSRWFAITSFGVAIGSAIMIDQILSVGIKNNKRLPYLVVASLILSPLITATITHLIFKFGWRFTNNISTPDMQEMMVVIKNTLISVRNSFIPLLLFGMTGWGLLNFKKINKYLLVLGIFGLTIFDLLRFFKKYNTFSPEKYLFPTNPSISYLQKNSTRFLREGGELIPSNMWMPYGLKAASGYDTLHSARYNGFISLVNGLDISNNTNRYLEVYNINSPYLNFLGISDLIALKRKDGKAESTGDLSYKIDLEKYSIAFEDKSTVVLKNSLAMPLVFPVLNYVVAKNQRETNELISKSDLTKTVVLEKEPGGQLGQELPIISDLNVDKQKTSLQVESKGKAILVTSQSFDPGWQLLIDGKKSEILTANYAFMAFKIPEGKHHLILKYQPKTFLWGIYGLAVSLGVLILIIVFGSIRKTFRK